MKWRDSTLRDLDASHREAFLNFSRRDARRGSWKDILPSSTWVSAGDDEAISVPDIVDFVSLRGTMAPMLSLRSSLVDDMPGSQVLQGLGMQLF